MVTVDRGAAADLAPREVAVAGGGAQPPAEAAPGDYFQRIAEQHLGALWTVPEPAPEPAPLEVPHVWRWLDVGPLLQEAADVMDITADAQRRVLSLRNPARKLPGTTHTLNVAFQLVVPGEAAPAHRHTMSAVRFVVDAEGGYTVVNGEKIPMHNGDLILTPNWTWHDHRNENDRRPMIWFDALDAPFTRSLQAVFYENYPGNVSQPLDRPTTDSANRFGASGLLPVRQRPRTLHSPLNVYPWQEAYTALQRLRHSDDDPYDGAILEYVNPITGGHVLPTMACYLQALRPGQRTRARRQTISKVYYVVKGSGHSIVNGQMFTWQERDVLVVPAWAWHEHTAESDAEAVLFGVSDLPVLEPFGLYREEPCGTPDGSREAT